MKRVLIIFLAFLMVSPFTFAAKRAFLVGISKYKFSTEWEPIHGSEDVELLKPELINQKFEVTTLTNAQATHDNIINCLEAFIKKIKKGDIVYIHFSTHGQPVEDYNHDEKEKERWDEAVVPYDAGIKITKNGYDGSKHITDDVINKYVLQIREKLGPKGALYVVIDACHAGGISRAGPAETIRGTNEGLSRSGRKYNHVKAENKWQYSLLKRPDLAHTLFLEACTSKQTNHEIWIRGKQYGSLSYMVYITIKDKKYQFGTKPITFENAVNKTIKSSREWRSQLSNKQHIVTEKSY